MIVLHEEGIVENFYPFTYTRHVAEIPAGIFSIKEKWQKLTGQKVELVKAKQPKSIPANIVPTKQTHWQIKDAAENGDDVYALNDLVVLHYCWDLYKYNAQLIELDAMYFDFQKFSLPNNNVLQSKDMIYVAASATVNRCILNADNGPIIIDDGAELMEGSCIRGPFYLGKNSVVKMGSMIYGGTTIGNNCMVGGEIKNSIFFESSNKAHYGYIGDSIIGAHCNLGAGTTCSNVKNTAGLVKYQLQKAAAPIEATQKAGLLMGDYSKAAINTSFYTGTVVGVGCNIFGNEIPPTFVENFTWGNNKKYELDKLIEDINSWMAFKSQSLTAEQIELLKNLYE
jgi:UDP-N-acetylglucosamine diphosphorylase / glucose-1-phosphate thymidylyltransferase / UDP-N-acetylgalactosamine diphosphorylase / glucosamine-1-phosphate N-acetyltransferase / galactosamine-1-phosphate N-acetyltransferase